MNESASLGARRLVSIGIALIGEPSVLLLDEPTLGMDPADAQQIWHLLTAYAHRPHTAQKSGFTVMVALSRVHEAVTFCDRMGLLLDGTLSWSGLPHELSEKFPGTFQVHLQVRPSTQPFSALIS